MQQHDSISHAIWKTQREKRMNEILEKERKWFNPSPSYKVGETVIATYDSNTKEWWYKPFVSWWKDKVRWVNMAAEDGGFLPMPIKHPLYDLLIKFYKPKMQKAYWDCICTSHSGQGTEPGDDDA